MRKYEGLFSSAMVLNVILGANITAIMGFSVANLDIFAISSSRFSGGNILSSHVDPLSRRPVRLPCSPPAMPDTISAMTGDLAV